ncbi:heme-binding domain-containing protein [Pseudobacter ginsenosidimutans]|uniref:Heme-binding protein n=1 Tax=Pseudobacter ginsenosidimutans TaxID=661488 RepID=A0A4Q7N389_9BACT|nr:heme-binding domain-containing protein [Pseudobacter ginsenosidimutans]QEC43606.1 cytochrome C [Pseudobacter ginsenosidimutans]RZS75005.1 heme-binding protein [Pseudobacter ginsenosidimutans]
MKKFFWLLLLALVIIQFFRPEKNIAAAASPTDIATKYAIPAEVKPILDKACNDCHSNNTLYPWYSNIQPVAWWLASHIKDGKRHLNFSTFTAYSYKRADHKMEEVIETVEKHEMPLPSYTWTHKDAKLTDAERTTLKNWAQQVRDQIRKDTSF